MSPESYRGTDEVNKNDDYQNLLNGINFCMTQDGKIVQLRKMILN